MEPPICIVWTSIISCICLSVKSFELIRLSNVLAIGFLFVCEFPSGARILSAILPPLLTHVQAANVLFCFGKGEKQRRRKQRRRKQRRLYQTSVSCFYIIKGARLGAVRSGSATLIPRPIFSPQRRLGLMSRAAKAAEPAKFTLDFRPSPL